MRRRKTLKGVRQRANLHLNYRASSRLDASSTQIHKPVKALLQVKVVQVTLPQAHRKSAALNKVALFTAALSKAAISKAAHFTAATVDNHAEAVPY